MLLNQGLDHAGAVEPLVDIRLLIPVRWPNRSLGRYRVQVWLITISPDVQLSAAQGLAGQGNGVQQCLPSARPVGAETEVEAVVEFDVLPCVVGLKVRGTNGYGGGVIGRPRRVDEPFEGIRKGGVIESVVLGVAADADVWLCALDIPKILQESVGKCVGMRVVS